MPRALSDDTRIILWWLWYLPWASAADIALITRFRVQAVSNALNRGQKAGWLISARLGRTRAAVDRYVFTTPGVGEFHRRYGWQIFWWHAADSVRSLARRLEVVEMAYQYLPLLWQSNLVVERKCYTYRERRGRNRRTGEPGTRVDLVEANWSFGKLKDFHWLQKGPFEAIATYEDVGGYRDDLLHIPVLWRGSFQKPADMAHVRREMREVFTEDERWGRLPRDQAISQDYCPGLVVFCPGRVSAAMTQRNWINSFTRETATRPAIIDATGQVVLAMEPPTAWWQDFRIPRGETSLKDVSQAVQGLKKGAYAAVNGVRAWRTFWAVDASPGVRRDQIAESVGVKPTVVRELLDAMVRAHVITIKAGGHYLDVSGRGLLASSQRVTNTRAKRRWGIYTRRGGEYRRAQRLHNQGQCEVIQLLRGHGYAAFPTMGLVIDHWHQGAA